MHDHEAKVTNDRATTCFEFDTQRQHEVIKVDSSRRKQDNKVCRLPCINHYVYTMKQSSKQLRLHVSFPM